MMNAMTILRVLVVLLVLTGCERFMNDNGIQVDLLPLRMTQEVDTFDLANLLLYDGTDSIWSSDMTVESIEDQKIVITKGRSGAFGILSFGNSEHYESAVVLYPLGKSVTLSFPDSAKSIGQVSVKGEMTNWRLKDCIYNEESGSWEHQLRIDPGRYQYTFVVDGKESLDPVNPLTTTSDLGTTNSLLEVRPPNENEVPILQTFEITKDHIVIAAAGKTPDKVVAIHANRQMPTILRNDSILVELPQSKSERSSLRIWASAGPIPSNDIFIPLEYGQPLLNTDQLKRTDWHAQIIYFPLIDRFNNGDRLIDEPVKDDRLIDMTNFMGGDIEGVTQKIEDGYLTSLGINSIWLSPITQNPRKAFQEYPEPRRWYSGYHGYWPVRSSKVDHRFGTDQSLKRLVQVAHANDINIFLDYICNHVHEEHPLYKAHPDWATSMYRADSSVNIRIWEEERLTTWFDDFLPSLDLSKPEVIRVQADSAFYWLKEFELDGYRHDATKHVPRPFWRELTEKLYKDVILEENRPVYQIGETYGPRGLIASYLGSGYMEAQFDFPLYFELRNLLLDQSSSFGDFATSLMQSLRTYGHHHLMGNMSGNHDQVRFVSLAGGAMDISEDPKEAGFNRTVGVGQEEGYKKLQLLHAVMMSIPGVPTTYYGDEIGMPGAGDPDCRRMMKFQGLNSNESTTKEIYSMLVSKRRHLLPLIYGTTQVVHADDESIVIKRKYFDSWVLCAFNKSGHSKEIELPIDIDQSYTSHFNRSLIQVDGKIQLKLEPYEFDYISG